MVAPVGRVRIDLVAAEDFAGAEVGDEDLVVIGEREDAFAGVSGTHAEGRLRGRGTTSLARCRIRLIVAGAGTRTPSRSSARRS